MSNDSRNFRAGKAALALDIANNDAGFKRLVSRAKQLERLNAAINPLLPNGLGSHCTVANFRDDTLIFVADSPVWGARLRQASAQILHTLSTNSKISAREIKVKVSPTVPHPVRIPQPRALSSTEKKHLQRVSKLINGAGKDQDDNSPGPSRSVDEAGSDEESRR